MYFLDADPAQADPRKRMMRASAQAGATLEIPNTEPGLPGDVSPDEAKLGYVASTSEVYRHKAFADCTDDELRQLRRARVVRCVRRRGGVTRMRDMSRRNWRSSSSVQSAKALWR